MCVCKLRFASFHNSIIAVMSVVMRIKRSVGLLFPKKPSRLPEINVINRAERVLPRAQRLRHRPGGAVVDPIEAGRVRAEDHPQSDRHTAGEPSLARHRQCGGLLHFQLLRFQLLLRRHFGDADITLSGGDVERKWRLRFDVDVVVGGGFVQQELARHNRLHTGSRQFGQRTRQIHGTRVGRPANGGTDRGPLWRKDGRWGSP